MLTFVPNISQIDWPLIVRHLKGLFDLFAEKPFKTFDSTAQDLTIKSLISLKNSISFEPIDVEWGAGLKNFILARSLALIIRNVPFLIIYNEKLENLQLLRFESSGDCSKCLLGQ